MRLVIYGTNTIREAVLSGNLSACIYINEKKRRSRFINKDFTQLLKSKNIKICVKDDAYFLKEFGREAFIKGIAAVLDYREKEFEEIFAYTTYNKPDTADLKKNPFYLLLDGVTDPQNLGSIARTANCAGVKAILIPKANSVYITSAVANVSQGAIFYTDIVRVVNIARTIDLLKKAGIWVIGLSNEAEEDIYGVDYNIPLAIVVGSEGKGLRRLTGEKCEKIVKIPMLGEINSLNASVSFGIIAYEILRQRVFKKA